MVTTSRSHPYTHVALESFARHTTLGPADNFFLIDNNSDFIQRPDLRTAPASATFAARIEMIRNPSPRGFSANANQMIERALNTGADLIFMNNDLVFAPNWLPPLLEGESAIVSPLCNRDVQYAISAVIPKTGHVSHVFALSAVMELKEYEGNAACFDAIAESHQRVAAGYTSALHVPFFCIRIPYAVLELVGRFDEQFGNGGGEDYDYGLRAYLAGSEIKISLASFILHFQGKSSWAGGETKEEQRAREEKFFQHFIQKWGNDLFELVLRENVAMLSKTPPIDPERPAESFRESIRILKGGLAPAIRM
jgi:GT2 family glycosyltransferase